MLTLPHIAKQSDGKPLASGETVVVINLEKKTGGLSNATVRGVAPAAFLLRPQVHIVEGRMFKAGAREVVTGSAIAKILSYKVGSMVTFGGNQWTIVGKFDADGSEFDSEMWATMINYKMLLIARRLFNGNVNSISPMRLMP